MTLIFSTAVKDLFKKNKKNDSTSALADKEPERPDENVMPEQGRGLPDTSELGKRSDDK